MSSMKPEWLREAVTDQAVEWFSRHRSGEPLGSAERDEFLAWLRASPLHVQGYLEVVKVAKLIPEALAGLEIGLPNPSFPGKHCAVPVFDRTAPQHGRLAPLGHPYRSAETPPIHFCRGRRRARRLDHAPDRRCPMAVERIAGDLGPGPQGSVRIARGRLDRLP